MVAVVAGQDRPGCQVESNRRPWPVVSGMVTFQQFKCVSLLLAKWWQVERNRL